MSLIMTITFEAAPGQRDALVSKMQSILHETRSFDGCERIVFAEAAEAPGSLVLIEEWASASQYDAYKAWRRESGTSVLAGDLVHGGAETSTFTIIDR